MRRRVQILTAHEPFLEADRDALILEVENGRLWE